MSDQPARATHVAALALDSTDRLVVASLRGVHARAAARVFTATGNLGGKSPKLVHDAVSGAIYRAVSGGLHRSSQIVRSLAEHGVGNSLENSTRGRQLLATINGLAGQHLSDADDPQALAMTLRHQGVDVPLGTTELEQVFQSASGHLVVLVHGLCESEEVWGTTENPRSLAGRLAHTTSTALQIRYNSGLTAGDNGASLAVLLRDAAAAWPVPVRRLTLVGHGMGSAVIRAAVNHALVAGDEWVHRVRDMVHLGFPQIGHPLEKSHQVVMAHFGGTRTVSAQVPVRQVTIIGDEDFDRDVTDHWGRDRLALAPLPTAAHHFLVCEAGIESGMSLGLEVRHPQIANWLIALVSSAKDPVLALTP